MKYSYALAAILGATTVLALPSATNPVAHKRDVVARRGLDTDDIVARTTTTDANEKRGAFDWMNDGGDWLNNLFSKRDTTTTTPTEPDDKTKALMLLSYLANNQNEKRGAFDWMNDGGDWLNNLFSKRDVTTTDSTEPDDRTKALMLLSYIAKNGGANEKRGAFDWMNDGGDWLNNLFSKRDAATTPTDSTEPDDRTKALMLLSYIAKNGGANEKRGAFDWMNDGGDWLNNLFSKRDAATTPTDSTEPDDRTKALMLLSYIAKNGGANEKRGAFDWMNDGGDWLNNLFSKREEGAAEEAQA